MLPRAHLDIGASLRKARHARALSLTDVAGQAGISAANLSRIENDKQALDVTLFVALSKIVGMVPWIVLGGDTSALPSPELIIDALARLDPAERAQIIVAASKRNRSAGHRVESLLAIVDILQDDILSLHATTNRRRKPRKK